MKLKLTRVAPQWYRVLELTNVYSEERELYTQQVKIVNGVSFISEKSLSVMRSKLGSNSFGINILSSSVGNTDYSSQVFLTNNEFKGFIVKETMAFLKEQGDLQFYLDHGFMNSDYKIVIYKPLEIGQSDNIYHNPAPVMDIVHVHKVEKITENIFDTQEAKDAFLQKERESFLARLSTVLEGK